MARIAVSLLLALAACVDSGDFGGGEPDSASVGAVARTVPRMFGMDISWSSPDTYVTRLIEAQAGGAKFMQQSIDWSLIEAGPDDAFNSAKIDTKKWDVVGTFAADDAADAVRYLAPTAGPGGALTSRYKLDTGVISAEVNAAMVNTPGTQAMLLLRFGSDLYGGGRCTYAYDEFAALVLTSMQGAPILVALSCRDGVLRTDGMVPTWPASAKLRISRGTTALTIRSATNNVASLTLSTLPAAFTGPARIVLFGGNSLGSSNVTFAGERVTGPVVWDHPTDRFVGIPTLDIPRALDESPLHIPLVVTLRTIDTVNTKLPSDLNVVDATTGKVDLSRPVVRQRFKEAVDYLLSQMPHVQVAGFSVGNEVDVYLTSPTLWAQTTTFANDVIPYVRSKLADGNPVGITVTSSGLLAHPTEVAALESTADTLFVTYYPLDATAAARDPSVVQGDMALFFAATPKPLLFIEAGYPSAPISYSCLTCKGSEAKQAAFFHQMFLAWDAHPDRILGFSVSWVIEMPSSALAYFLAYYGVSSPNFAAFLSTLGVRSENGTPKAAWTTIQNDAHARGL